jgi:hypothetical protein
MIGDSTDIIERVKRLIPGRWFAWAAPYRDGVLGGIADAASWCYGWIGYAALQTRLATATGIWLDIWSYDYLRRYLPRAGRGDTIFRAIIQATILQERVTRAGMMNAITALVGTSPGIIEPWSTGDCGGWGGNNFGYGIAGAWGSIQLPGQTFIKVSRRGLMPSGVPSVEGYGGVLGGYGVGGIQYVGSEIAEVGVINTEIYNIIKYTKPTGVIAWTRIGA